MTVTTDIAIKALKPKDKIYYEHVEEGLYVHVRPNGRKSFQYKFRLDGRTQQIGLGTYPDVSLATARRAHEAARAKVRAGIHPNYVEKPSDEEIAKHNFQRIALEWLALRSKKLDNKYAGVILRFLHREIFPTLGSLDIREIKKPMVEALLVKIKNSGAEHLSNKKERWETSKKARQRISAIFRYAAHLLDILVVDPIPAIMPYLEDAPPPVHLPAVTNLDDVRQILRDTASSRAYSFTKLAIYFTALTCMRSSEVRLATWDEFDLNTENPVWRIPGERMKMGRPHTVPVTPELLLVINALQKINGNDKYVFTSNTDEYGERAAKRPKNKANLMSENTVNHALHRLGYKGKHVGHGFRSAFSTIMNERHPELETVIDVMLAHKVGTEVSRAYNRGNYEAQARKLAEEYAKLLLDGLPAPAELLSGPAH